jgi:hypothetical protein
MEDIRCVLVDRAQTPLFVRLTFGKKKKRPQWDQTQNLKLASEFKDYGQAILHATKHKVPPSCAVPVSIGEAHSLLLAAKKSRRE